MIPFSLIANPNVSVPAPKVAATNEKMDPDVPPALNFLYVKRIGDIITDSNLFLDPPGLMF